MGHFLKYFKIRYIRKNQGGNYEKVALKIAKNGLNFRYRGTPWQNKKQNQQNRNPSQNPGKIMFTKSIDILILIKIK